MYESLGFEAELLYFSLLQVNQQRQKLHDLQTLIDNLSSGQETVSDKAFEDRLKEAERAIMELLEEAQASKGNSSVTISVLTYVYIHL